MLHYKNNMITLLDLPRKMKVTCMIITIIMLLIDYVSFNSQEKNMLGNILNFYGSIGP